MIMKLQNLLPTEMNVRSKLTKNPFDHLQVSATSTVQRDGRTNHDGI